MRPQVERVGYPRALVETAEPSVEYEDARPVACDLDLDWALRGRDDPGAARERCPAPHIGERERNHAEPQSDRACPHPRAVCGPAAWVPKARTSSCQIEPAMPDGRDEEGRAIDRVI